MLDWRVKTPSIAGPMVGVSVPWVAVWVIACIVGAMFYTLSMFYDRLASVGMAFSTGFILWCLASVRTRQDRDWTNIALEKVTCRARMLAMYLWNKYHYGWPV